jgi:hypothetical protein
MDSLANSVPAKLAAETFVTALPMTVTGEGAGSRLSGGASPLAVDCCSTDREGRAGGWVANGCCHCASIRSCWQRIAHHAPAPEVAGIEMFAGQVSTVLLAVTVTVC